VVSADKILNKVSSGMMVSVIKVIAGKIITKKTIANIYLPSNFHFFSVETN